ncbi:MAG: hypothetical protein HY751_06475 [Nitrospinae bacterium]|nr:hypothetical protein [Nitrospinota bacterium]
MATTLHHFGEGHPEDLAHRDESVPILVVVFGMGIFAAALMFVIMLGMYTTTLYGG